MKGKKLNKNLQYLSELPSVMKDPFVKCSADPADKAFTSIESLITLLKHNALLSVAHSMRLFASPKYKGYNNWELFYQTFQLDLVRMSTAHSHYMAAFYAHNSILALSVEFDNNSKVYLTALLRIWCLKVLLKNASALATSLHLSSAHYKAMQQALNQSYQEIRPQVLNLVECFEYDDNTLNSAIGSFDG